MMGQGIGPIHDPELRALAADILPRIAFFPCEKVGLASRYYVRWGLPADRIMVTGDDAIELAFQSRTAKLGNGLGVNLRIADYAGLSPRMVDSISAHRTGRSEEVLSPADFDTDRFEMMLA